MALKPQIAATVDEETHSALIALAADQERSMAQVLRRACRREISEHRAEGERLINGRTRAAQRKTKTRKSRAAA